MRRINYFVTTGGGGGGGGFCCWQEERTTEVAMRARIAIFMLYVGVNQFVKVPIHQTPGSGIFEINDKFCFCKYPNAFTA